MIGYRGVRLAIVLADEATNAAQAEMHEPLVADHDALEPQQLV